MELLFTKDSDWLKRWDDYVLNENKASHLLLSDWNKSFQNYGFDFEICIALEDNKIIGGFSAVIAKALFLKFYIIPFGPILSHYNTENFNQLISKVKSRANFLNCCYCHITLPSSKVINAHVISEIEKSALFSTAKEGHRFNYVYSSNGLNWKRIDNFENEEMLISSFKASVRRYIRSSIRKGMELQFAVNEEQIKKGYELCLKNAKENGYALRDWDSFGKTISALVKNDTAKFLIANYQGTIKGSAFIVKSGNYYTYILGGTVKEKPDFLAGHFLHYSACKLAWQEKFDGYNISLGGSIGVVNLKNSYADEQIYFENSKYYWILKPTQFKMFVFLEKFIKKHKKNISKVLSKAKR
ncbi:peptidoglycan bridge formation glycyltransferase FemA/FemB family protein [Flavobacterium sp.]|uniref:peptidoglycan bridge formation glycyltransferase FemA/FemB family protein n=1 Tax=Flavobacterium sp. TaxID=239 RepID=UPI00248778E7|nr:peptidoglycan bridge formation glycyltransferase FemA/FemB family protein [Flavobacterium sp.]MDI1316116.1 peptidoglycan bridge formation glycyltransferase FemA/FemB family protein [Flavobacterium sp.]